MHSGIYTRVKWRAAAPRSPWCATKPLFLIPPRSPYDEIPEEQWREQGGQEGDEHLRLYHRLHRTGCVLKRRRHVYVSTFHFQ